MATRNANSCVFGVHGKDFKIMGLHGAGQAQAYYDATGFWIAPAGHDAYGGGTTANSEGVVGAAAGVVGAPPITLSRKYIIGGSGNATTVATDLFAYTLLAGTFSRNGQAIRIRATGNLAANSNAKTLTVKIGTTTLTFLTTNTGITNGAQYEIDVTIIRTGLSTQLITGIMRLGEITVATAITGITAINVMLAPVTAALSEVANIALSLTATGVSNNDIVAYDFKVDMEQA